MKKPISLVCVLVLVLMCTTPGAFAGGKNISITDPFMLPIITSIDDFSVKNLFLSEKIAAFFSVGVMLDYEAETKKDVIEDTMPYIYVTRKASERDYVSVFFIDSEKTLLLLADIKDNIIEAINIDVPASSSSAVKYMMETLIDAGNITDYIEVSRDAFFDVVRELKDVISN